MDYENQEMHDEEVELPPSHYDSLGNNSSFTQPAKMQSPRYKECLKNHAVGIGAHAVDGCGEFLPAGPEGSVESLKCAACNCHRNFHRKEVDSGGSFSFHLHNQPQQLLLTRNPHGHSSYSAPSRYLQKPEGVRHLALPSSSGGGSGSGDELDRSVQHVAKYYSSPSGGSAKRFRTKFTEEQKKKMLNFAEQVGWRIQKQDEDMVQQFCSQVGVKRQVLKVWMHNNKHTRGKKTELASQIQEGK